MTRTYETTYKGHTFTVTAVTGLDDGDTCTLSIDGKLAESRVLDPGLGESAEYAFNDMRDTLIHVFQTLGK